MYSICIGVLVLIGRVRQNESICCCIYSASNRIDKWCWDNLRRGYGMKKPFFYIKRKYLHPDDGKHEMKKPFSYIKRKYLNPDDGTLRDFYIFDVSESDWNKFLSLVPEIVDHFTFKHNGVKVPLPSKLSDIANLEQVRYGLLLSMSVSGLVVNCFFNANDEIYLNFSVFDIQNAEIWENLLAFFQKIVDHIGKKGIITYEWNYDIPEIRPDLVIDEILPSTHTPRKS